jgi:hypothetical protein
VKILMETGLSVAYALFWSVALSLAALIKVGILVAGRRRRYPFGVSDAVAN